MSIEAAFDGHGKRAALMPYLMGGFPSLEKSAAAGLAAAEAGADLLELGIPFSDPLADGATIRETVLRLGYVERGELTEEQLDEALDVESMTRPRPR